MAGMKIIGGTLCRLVPTLKQGDRVVRWRVEIGDLGAEIGVVMKSPGRDLYEAFYTLAGGAEELGPAWESPESAALRVSAQHYVQRETEAMNVVLSPADRPSLALVPTPEPTPAPA